MNHDDHVQLIETGLERNGGGVWADFGAGSGAFTLACAKLPGRTRHRRHRSRPGQPADPTRHHGAALSRHPAPPPRGRHGRSTHVAPLDGIIAANPSTTSPSGISGPLGRWKRILKPEGRLIVVEYDSETGNSWVPYPMSYAPLRELAPAAGFTEPVLLGVRPSRWLASIYAAVTIPFVLSSRSSHRLRDHDDEHRAPFAVLALADLPDLFRRPAARPLRRDERVAGGRVLCDLHFNQVFDLEPTAS